MEIRGVITNQSDSCMPRLAFFASQDIVEGAELTFDYQFIGLRTHSKAPGLMDISNDEFEYILNFCSG